MDAIAAQFGGEIGPVIEDEGRAVALHDRAQRVAGAADFVIAGMLEAQLEAAISPPSSAARKGMTKFAGESFGGETR